MNHTNPSKIIKKRQSEILRCLFYLSAVVGATVKLIISGGVVVLIFGVV
jgi:hypothetical protein